MATTYTWNAASDRLTAYALDRAPFGSPDVAAAFTYDASGQRTGSTVTSGGVATTAAYTYEGLLLTRLVSTTGSVTTTLTYLYDERSRPLAATASFSDTTAVYPFSPSVNARGDVRALVDMNMNPFVSWAYDAFGNPTVAVTAGTTGSAMVPASIAARIAAVQPLRYAGYAYDEFSGLYYCSQRYYDPATMQFISADPAQADGEESAYQYCGGDPVGKSDPSGLSPWKPRYFHGSLSVGAVVAASSSGSSYKGPNGEARSTGDGAALAYEGHTFTFTGAVWWRLTGRRLSVRVTMSDVNYDMDYRGITFIRYMQAGDRRRMKWTWPKSRGSVGGTSASQAASAFLAAAASGDVPGARSVSDRPVAASDLAMLRNALFGGDAVRGVAHFEFVRGFELPVEHDSATYLVLSSYTVGGTTRWPPDDDPATASAWGSVTERYQIGVRKQGSRWFVVTWTGPGGILR